MCRNPIRRWGRLDILDTRTGIVRPKRYWEKVIRKNITNLQIKEDLTLVGGGHALV